MKHYACFEYSVHAHLSRKLINENWLQLFTGVELGKPLHGSCAGRTHPQYGENLRWTAVHFNYLHANSVWV